MKQEDFEQQARDASKAMLKKKAPTRPDTQFMKGAMWAWQMLVGAKERPYYVERLRQEVEARLGEEGMRENAGWIESLLEETAEKMCRLDAFKKVVEEEGYLLDKYDKMQNTLVRQFEALGLIAKGKAGAAGGGDAIDDDPVLNMLSNK